MDWHKYQKLLYWKDFVMNCFCFQIFCDHLIVMRYFVMGDHVMAINVPPKTRATAEDHVTLLHWQSVTVRIRCNIGSVQC